MYNNADILSHRPCDSGCHCSRRKIEPVRVKAAVLSSAAMWKEDLAQAQREDADIRRKVTLREEDEEKPLWKSVAALSLAAAVGNV